LTFDWKMNASSNQTLAPKSVVTNTESNQAMLIQPANTGGSTTSNEKGPLVADLDIAIGRNAMPDFLGQDFQDRNGQHHPIAEFLYQLTKMLTDENSEIIEWSDGRIKVHYPERLEGEVLQKYFRHSKFASFQRQLNYFGFRKIAGKGKMSPCSYVNEAATSDIRSLLLIKRKTNGSAARKAAMQQHSLGLPAYDPNSTASSGMNFPGLSMATGSSHQQMSLLNGQQSIANAMALLSENALRAGLGQYQMLQQQQQQSGDSLGNHQLNLFALQQQQQQQRSQHQFLSLQQAQQELQQQQQTSSSNQRLQEQNQLGSNPQFGQHALQHLSIAQGQQHNGSQVTSNNASQNIPSLEQLRAQLAASLASQHGSFNASLLNSGLNIANNPVVAGVKLNASHQTTSANPASAALKALTAQTPAMPATAAMDAASATAQTNSNLFDSAANLKSLLGEHSSNQDARPSVPTNSTPHVSSALLNRLPSSSTIFPELSTASFGNLLASSNRLNSLLSLNSFLGSREPSLADFAAANNMSAHQLAANAANGMSHFASDASKFRSNH
jgi:hypothetical protein